MNPGDFVQHNFHCRSSYCPRGGSLLPSNLTFRANGNYFVNTNTITNAIVGFTANKSFENSYHSTPFTVLGTRMKINPHYLSPFSPNSNNINNCNNINQWHWQSPPQERLGRKPKHFSPSPSPNSSPSYLWYHQTFSNNSSSMSGYFPTSNSSPGGKRQSRGSHSYRGRSSMGSANISGSSCNISNYVNSSMLQNPWQELEQMQKSFSYS
ncbi:uncharacterized protein LOC111086220 [Limulus polyphemus]|uniref:Uncharacterized protein LOC111086220 n=1 Tax=Limulus polyphemus TaxID=6850 RepID=A0ABM1SJS8_LIMPO|nr:uncharacterized protein LOC111086220 [Limulus polyphemus]